jgi:benzoylformate decarboxylase
MAERTVRDAAIEVFHARGMTRMFANPGSTEVPFLVDLPPDLEFVLGLHEGTVVGMATGWAIGRDEPALVLLHTTAGLGNAVGALATARVNRAPLVVLVGQQDRRHLAHEPFLAGRLEGLAGTYPVSVEQPVTAQELPGAIGRAWHAATTRRGPALVIVPMDDWLAPAGAEDAQTAAAGTVLRAAAADPAAVDALVALLDAAERPALVVGAGADDRRSWDALVEVSERLGAPVWQEAFGARAGFPQDHPRFAGHLPSDRSRLRAVLEPFDAVLVVGAPAFRQYAFVEGPFHGPGTRVAVVTDDPDEAHRSAAELVVLAPVGAACEALAARLAPREPTSSGASMERPPNPGTTDGPLTSAHVFSALARRLPTDAILFEEAPSSKPELHARIPSRAPLGFLSPAMGGLGFAIPAAIGVRMALPERGVVAVVGDGSSLYAIQALWSAAHYGVGAVFVILANGGYAVMDRLAELQGGTSVWPRFPDIDLSGLARSFGCPTRRVGSFDELEAAFDEIVPGLADRGEPLFLEVAVAPDDTFVP